MNKIFIIFLVVLFSALSLKSQSLQKQISDPHTGYWNSSVANNSPAINHNDNSLVFTWQPVTLPQNVNVLSVMFVDTLNGWLSHTSNGAMRTSDGGSTWNLI